MTSTRLSRRGALLGGGALVLGGCVSHPAAASEPDGVTERLGPALDRALDDRSTSLLVMQGGRILAERYAPDWPADRPRELASVAKSIVAVLIGMAIEDGFIAGLDQSAADFIPQWRDDARRAITLRHLMSMTSGLDDTGLALRGVTGDQFVINAAAPLRDPPGSRWAYNTAAYHLLFHVLVRATGEGVESHAQRKLLGPLGMENTRWVTSPGRGAGEMVTNYYSAAATARDLARFGALVLNGGRHEGRQLIRADFLQTLTTSSQTLNPSYGLLWWCNALPGFDATGRVAGYRFPRSPRETVAALGAGGQAVLLVPSRALVVVRQGGPPAALAFFDDLLSSVVAAVDV